MSGDAPIIRELLGFDGAVECEQQADAKSLRLRGAVRGSGGSCTEVWFSGVSFSDTRRGDAVSMPAVLQRVSVLELAPAQSTAPRRAFRIEAGADRFELQAASVQVHREAAREFFGAVPPPRVPRATRLGWLALLSILRVPGAVRLLMWLRG